MNYPIPDSALAQHIAILGKTGSGKTTAAKAAAELILDDGGRVCVVDPTGAWWGMKSSATGKSAGFPVVIFGGLHADFPLASTHGEAIAEIVGTTSTPAILDTSQMRVGERTKFFADFADGIMRRNRGPLHLIIDEAHMFMPQGKVPDPASGIMLAAGNNLVSGGRSRGLRIMLITQRPAKLHKDALTQVETLVAMRLIAPQDRKAVEEWIKDNADAAKGREIIESLATLKTGQGWVWAPEIGLLERVTFPRIRTFDSSAAPAHADGDKGPVLAAIDKDAILTRLKTHAEQVIANDPAELKKRIRELEKQVAAKVAPALSAAELSDLQKEAWADGQATGKRDGLEHAATVIRTIGADIAAMFQRAIADAAKISQHLPAIPRHHKPALSANYQGDKRALRPANAQHAAKHSHGGNGVGDSSLPKGEAAVLASCIQFPLGLKREQLTVLTGYKRSSRDAYIQRLRERGYVTTGGDLVVATDEGHAALPDAHPLPTGQALQDYWLAKLPEGERKILGVLIEQYPDPVPRADLDERTGYQRSSRDAYLQRLRAKQLVTEASRGEVRASEDLF